MGDGATRGLATSRHIQAFLAATRRSALKVDDGDRHWAFASDPLGGAMRGIIGLPTLGCSYARTAWGGCAICGHHASLLWDAGLSVPQIVEDARLSLAALDAIRPARLCLYTSGSFLDDKELPATARAAILADVRRRDWIRTVSIESLPQYVTGGALRHLRAALGDRTISIGIGVDSSDAFTRSLCFQRHISERLYLRAIETCRAAQVETIGYIVHQPPFLTEREAVFDTARSIGALVAWGFDRVSIEPAALQAGTLQSRLHAAGAYAPPSFWAVVSAVNAAACSAPTALQGRLLLGGEVFTPLPTRTLRGCASCKQEAGAELGPLSPLFADVAGGTHGPDCGDGLIDGQAIDPEALAARVERILERASRTGPASMLA